MFEERGYLPFNGFYKKEFNSDIDNIRIASCIESHESKKVNNVKFTLTFWFNKLRQNQHTSFEKYFRIPISSEAKYKYIKMEKVINNIEIIANYISVANKDEKLIIDDSPYYLHIKCKSCKRSNTIIQFNSFYDYAFYDYSYTIPFRIELVDKLNYETLINKHFSSKYHLSQNK